MDAIEKNDLTLFQQLLRAKKPRIRFGRGVRQGRGGNRRPGWKKEKFSLNASMPLRAFYFQATSTGLINGKTFLDFFFFYHTRTHSPVTVALTTSLALRWFPVPRLQPLRNPKTPISRISWWDAQRFAEAQSLFKSLPSNKCSKRAKEPS